MNYLPDQQDNKTYEDIVAKLCAYSDGDHEKKKEVANAFIVDIYGKKLPVSQSLPGVIYQIVTTVHIFHFVAFLISNKAYSLELFTKCADLFLASKDPVGAAIVADPSVTC